MCLRFSLKTVKLIHLILDSFRKETQPCNILVSTLKIFIHVFLGWMSDCVKLCKKLKRHYNQFRTCWRSPFPVNATVTSWVYPSALSNFIPWKKKFFSVLCPHLLCLSRNVKIQQVTCSLLKVFRVLFFIYFYGF